MKALTLTINRSAIFKIGLVIALCSVVFLGSFTIGGQTALNQYGEAIYQKGRKDGYNLALEDVQALLAQKGVDIVWSDVGGGRYRINVTLKTTGQSVFSTYFEIHATTQQFRPYINLTSEQRAKADTLALNSYNWTYFSDLNHNGAKDFPAEYSFLIHDSYHTMTTVYNGMEWIEKQLFNPGTDKALYLGVTNSETAVSTAWTALPSEIATDGLARGAGTYVNITSPAGRANVTRLFNVTGTVSCCAYGVYYTLAGNSLVCAEQQGSGSRKNFIAGDSLRYTVQWAHS